ncbi:MAG: cytochrome c peroxidase [Oleiphilaceae bacterium]|jgi:cytochrome c peroxidase
MKKMMVGLVLLGFALSLMTGCGGDSSSDSVDSSIDLSTKALLGEQLFADKNLSFNRTQSCATCHNPKQGLVDDRGHDGITGTPFAASLGDNGVSLGDRNAPTASYAAFSPIFKEGSRERVASQQTSGVENYEGFLGGQFLDGREADLAGQAGGPPTNPTEMGMPDNISVVERLKGNPDYVVAFENLYGIDIFDDADIAYAAMAESIAAFETQDAEQFYPFDSKYDRYLLGHYEYPVTSKAIFGKTLFFSSDLTCASCHQLQKMGEKGEIFTSFEYHNIGIPTNTLLREANGVDVDFIDEGLFLNAAVDAETERGKFKVPTLRNVAVTAPYMHNGVFQKLDTVIRFYEHAKTRALGKADTVGNESNPETGLPWAAPELADNLADDLLGSNDTPIDDDIAAALECFFLSLTDARYESLLDPDQVSNCGLDNTDP